MAYVGGAAKALVELKLALYHRYAPAVDLGVEILIQKIVELLIFLDEGIHLLDKRGVEHVFLELVLGVIHGRVVGIGHLNALPLILVVEQVFADRADRLEHMELLIALNQLPEEDFAELRLLDVEVRPHSRELILRGVKSRITVSTRFTA